MPKGIFLMGDFPFLVSKESVDVWQYPRILRYAALCRSASGLLQQGWAKLGIASLALGQLCARNASFGGSSD